MAKIERMRKAIQEAEDLLMRTKCYGMSFDELKELKGTSGDSYYPVLNGYYYGFIKGIRYQKAQEKKKRRKAVKA